MKTIKEQVDSIQEILFANNDNTPYRLRYIEEGFVEAVDLLIYLDSMEIKISIWNSENESREWIENNQDYEPFGVYLISQINEVLKNLQILKMIIPLK